MGLSVEGCTSTPSSYLPRFALEKRCERGVKTAVSVLSLHCPCITQCNPNLTPGFMVFCQVAASRCWMSPDGGAA